MGGSCGKWFHLSPPESRGSFPLRMAYLSAIGATRERIPLDLPAHFEVQSGILLRPQLVLDLGVGRVMAIFTAGAP